MAITITVETGAQVVNANSYISVANVRIYAANRGIALPVINDEVAVMIIKANDYLEAQAERYQGEIVSSDQALQWPRKCVYINGALVPSNVIPKSLISAQSQLVIAINAGFDLQPNVAPGDYVVKEKVGPIETEYANPLQVGIEPTFTAAEALLAPLFNSNSKGFSFKTIRV